MFEETTRRLTAAADDLTGRTQELAGGVGLAVGLHDLQAGALAAGAGRPVQRRLVGEAVVVERLKQSLDS